MSPARAGSHNRASKWRGEDDFYETPPFAIVPLLETGVVPARFWEPCCGAGAISKVAIGRGFEVASSNLVDYGYGTTGLDFLLAPCLPDGVSCILTNPPFGIIDDIVVHAWSLGAADLFILARTKFLEGAKRHERIHSRMPLKHVFQFVERIKFFSGSAPKEDQPGWNTEAFAWFHWQRGYEGSPQIRWIHRGKEE